MLKANVKARFRMLTASVHGHAHERAPGPCCGLFDRSFEHAHDYGQNAFFEHTLSTPDEQARTLNSVVETEGHFSSSKQAEFGATARRYDRQSKTTNPLLIGTLTSKLKVDELTVLWACSRTCTGHAHGHAAEHPGTPLGA